MEILGGVIAVYAGLVAVLYGMQRKLLYHPDQTIPSPEAYGVPEMQALRIPTEDGCELLTWWRPPANRHRPVLVYFHGNAGHIGERAEKVRDYLDAGMGVLLLSYRYNAGTGGKPGEAALFADARAAMAFLRAQDVTSKRIVLYGESLGSGVAVATAATHDVGLLALEAPYSAMAELAQHHYWYTPARWLIRDRFDSLSRIGSVTVPVIVVHGLADPVIPPRFGKKLFDAANEPKEAQFIEGGLHSDLQDYGLARLVLTFIEKHLGRPA